MSATTRLEVMAEVGRLADELKRSHMISHHDPHVAANMAESYAAVGKDHHGELRRKNMARATAWALLALEAHDAEAAQAPAHNPGPEVA